MMKRNPSSDTEAYLNKSELQKYVEDLTDAFIENIEDGMLQELDPYDAYANHIRHQVYKNMMQFRERFSKGYQVLLNEIKETQSGEEQ